MSLRQFIEQLSTQLGFEQELEPNEDGSYSLRFEPDIDVRVKEETDLSIHLTAQLADLPSMKKEEFLLKAMIANLFGRETGGAALGLDNEGKKIVLVDFLADEHNYRTFHDRLEDFVNYADVWRQETIEFAEKQALEE